MDLAHARQATNPRCVTPKFLAKTLSLNHSISCIPARALPAYGSYSNWPLGLTIEGHQNLRANVGRVWFAGGHTSDEFNAYLQGAYFEGQYVKESVATCVNGTYADCPGEKHFETLGETNKKDDLMPENGWFKSSFQIVGDVDLRGGE